MAPRASRGVRLASTAGAVGGVLLFAWAIRSAGVDAVVDGIRRVGAGFAAVLVLGGLRHLFRAAGWTLCLDRDDRLPLPRAFGAYLAGDALGNVTPFGWLISEPSKIVLVSGRIAPQPSIAALTIENLFYGATVAAVLVAGTIAFLLAFGAPAAVRAASLATLAAAGAAAGIAVWIVIARRPIASGTAEWLIRHGIAADAVAARLPHVRDVEQRVFGFTGSHPRKVLPLVGLEVAYHAAAIAEVWIVLALVTGHAPSVLTAFVLEYVNRTITVVFQFVPMWLGVDEAGTGLATGLLHLGAAPGVTLALVRKARILVWTAIGLTVLAHQGVSLRAHRQVWDRT